MATEGEADLYASVIKDVKSGVSVDDSVLLSSMSEASKKAQMALNESSALQKWFELVNRHGRTLVDETLHQV